MPWKKGTPAITKNRGNGWVNKRGYFCIKVDGKQKRVHRLVVESFIGRNLLPHEDVHHINGDKLDNRIENLQVMTKSSHAVLSNKTRIRNKGYKINISDNERERRSVRMKIMRAQPKSVIPQDE